jgi:hypothetical protein
MFKEDSIALEVELERHDKQPVLQCSAMNNKNVRFLCRVCSFSNFIQKHENSIIRH